MEEKSKLKTENDNLNLEVDRLTQ